MRDGRENDATSADDASALVEVGMAPSSLLSSWWSRDNLITSHPGRLYDGRVLERIDVEALEYVAQELAELRGSLRVGEGRMGVFTWDFACEDDAGRFVLQLPVALDEPGRRGRAKRDVPRQNFENAKYFIARGLARYVAEPDGFWTLASGVPVATFRAFDGYVPVSFGAGAVQLSLADGWTVALGPGATAEILAEIIAALVYHYEPDEDGGTALTDVFVNDGDFVVKRRLDGTFELRLGAARRREHGIGPNLLLLYLVQLMAYEDFAIGDALSGLPTLLSNPAVTFEGVVRGLRYRYADTTGVADEGEREARRWIAEFGRSLEGRAYRSFVERFLDGGLPLRFGDDARERWWRLFPQQSKASLLELRGRAEPASGALASARELNGFLGRISREIGRSPEEAGVQLNDLGRDALITLLAEANVDAAARDGVADAFFQHWPHRSLDALLARVPGARGFRRLKSRLSFGRVVSPDEQGTLKALGPAPKHAPARVVANAELFDAVAIAPSLQALAVRTFPTFEGYMDAALHDQTWGYYAHRVVIADGGHFLTHPEELSPHYGAWVAAWAFKAWRDLISHGDLAEDEAFPLIEFGAGNGRLARDVLAAVDKGPARAESAEKWRIFAERLSYRIYELSASLREKQGELLGERVSVAEGDARRARETLKRDFPHGVRGLVVTNELPDAFGVHKVVMTADARAFVALVALVVPRVEPRLREALPAALGARTASADSAIRRAFGFERHPDDHYLDAETFAEVMRAVALSGEAGREQRLAGLWFEEAYVAASALPALAAHLEQNAAEYRAALAAEPSGVVLYVNVHASDFMRELGAALKAGFVVTIDYGDSTERLVQGARRGDFLFRVYGESREYVPRPNDPYFAPGTQDLTADVNFTDLARAGQECGLQVIHFGPERDIVADALPVVIRSAASAAAFERFLGNPPFKVLVLGTRASHAFESPLMTALALTRRAV